MEEKIIFVDEDGNEIEMYVIEETRINNVNYLLVTDDEGDSEEAEAYILKDISNDEDEEAVYGLHWQSIFRVTWRYRYYYRRLVVWNFGR